jgi:predicted membrane protein
MNRTCTIIFFAVLFLLIAALYVYIYHFKKKKIMAIAIASVLGVTTLLSIIFVLPFPHRSTIIDVKTSKMTIETKNNKNYAVCDDGKEYPLMAMNTKMTSGYYSYQNDSVYANEKVEITRRYNYKIWWIIPAYSLEYETQIYFDKDAFYELYGCELEVNTTHK